MNACIATVAQMDGSSIITVDALAEAAHRAVHDGVPRQSVRVLPRASSWRSPALLRSGCGAKTAARFPLRKQERAHGNLCRCTGYQPIVDAATALDIKRAPPSSASGPWPRAGFEEGLEQPVALEAGEFSFYAPRTLKEAAAYLKRHRDARILSAVRTLALRKESSVSPGW